MALAKNDYESSFKLCNCYKVENLTETILETDQTSNLKDRYVLGAQLGWGQFGVIRECSDKLTGELLACKSISKNRLVTDEDVRSIKLEIEIMTRLSGHPNVVDLKAVYEEEGYVHLVMELCAGGELFHRLEQQGRFSESEARVLFKDLMQVVRFCHDKGVVHRDLKPENILLATKASSSHIKLADFGLATYIKLGQRLHGTVGSPFYIAPEVLAGGYNQSADVWSAGVILYILLSGKPPFWGKTKSRIFDAVRAASLRFQSDPWNGISDSAKELIRGMLNTDPSVRLTTQQVLDHVWTNGTDRISDSLPNPGELEIAGSPSLLMARNADISFGLGSPIIREAFSSFLMEPVTPLVNACGFSFRSSGGSSTATLDFCTPIHSSLSFAFFGVGPEAENGSLVVSISEETRDLKEQKSGEVKRGSGSRIWGSYNKRNRTIGLGEFEPLDVVVAESVIRWASCTHLSTALRSDFVC
ncbi:calcium-dependent protein kinase 17-like [Bidens hawaiensis]|uniref:calcium-dependent protein kinase 17-like n=1 Tax=Bidens hawaiensis TaxID=980011 RepID=UPI00404920D3